MSKYILVLSHQGYSFLEKLKASAEKLGLELVVLSSKPRLSEREEELKLLNLKYLQIVEEASLDRYRVENILNDLLAMGISPLFCISVWEGYREIMSLINEKLGANDIKMDTVRLLRNKLELRESLNKSEIFKNTNFLEVNSEESFIQAKSIKTKMFIKPVVGLGSFGASKFENFSGYRELLKLSKSIQEDEDYSGYFVNDKNGKISFICEEFLEGAELSAEIVMSDGVFEIFEFHEKLQVTYDNKTTLENACVSPPRNITEESLKKCEELIMGQFKLWNILNGCFHVELKYNQVDNSWSVIEINPRVGGSLIAESVNLRIKNENILSAWMKSLLGTSNKSRINSEMTSTYFYVYFGKAGKKVKKTLIKKLQLKPEVAQVLVKNGSVLSHSEREHFVGQALWKFSSHNREEKLDYLSKNSENLMEVIYE